MRKSNLLKILALAAFWTLAAIFQVSYEASVVGFEARAPGRLYSYGRIVLIVTVVGAIASTAVAACEVLFLSRVLRRRPYGITLITKTAFYLFCMSLVISVVVLIIYSRELDRPILHEDVLALYQDFLVSPQGVLTVMYWGGCVLFALFVVQVSEKFGQGVLFDFLMGKYHRPKEERRIFMFMDLRSSTTYAEELGHIRYSRLIQDCFFDLTDVVVKHNARIYQYVGDEVVLTWDVENGMRDGHCIEVFYAYDEAIRQRRAHYESNYGLVPQFKAGLNVGRVTVAEVGEIKKELAYHGDVLNTASRIQGKCNELGKRLLISDHMKELLSGLTGYEFDFVGDVTLKGKKEAVRIYGVEAARA